MYDKLERTVLPLFYREGDGWLAVMRGAIAKNAAFFNSHRMMQDDPREFCRCSIAIDRIVLS